MVKEIKRRSLGRTGVYVTELSFGAMNLRLLKNFDEAYEIVNYVLDKGINLIDTARAYNGTLATGETLESEKVVSKVISERKDLKEPIVIITKGHGYTPDEFDKDLAVSLKALGVEGKGTLKIGDNEIKLVYFFHGLSTERWDLIQSSGALKRAAEAKEEGLINYLGFSSHYPFPKEIKEAVDTGYFDVVELPYNVFNPSLGDSLFEHIHKKNVGIINMKAFDGNATVHVYKMLREFIDIDYDKMLNFCLSNPYITTVDAGAKYVSEFAADIETALKQRLTDGEKTALTSEAGKIAKYTKKLCRQCMHCIEKFECPNGVQFPEALTAYSKYLLSTNLGKDSSAYIADYAKLEVNAESCTECGACLPWCEYKLNIPEMLKNAHLSMK